MNTNTDNTTATATATATAPAPAPSKAGKASKASKPKAAPAPAPAPAGWRVGAGGVPAKAAAQVDAAIEAAALALGYPVATDEELNRLRSFAGRAAALAAEQGKGRVSGKGGTEAAARWDAKDVCAKAGFPLHVLALGLALVKAAADFRKAEAAE